MVAKALHVVMIEPDAVSDREVRPEQAEVLQMRGRRLAVALQADHHLRLGFLHMRVQPDTDRWLTTAEVLAAATQGSARALGFGDRLGRIAPGYKADIVFLELHNVNWLPFNNAVNQLVHTEDGAAVHSVMVGGRMVVEDRRVIGVDMAALARRVEETRARLEGATRPNKQLFEQVEQVVNSFCPGLAKMPYHVDRFGGGHHGHEHAAFLYPK